MKKQKNMGNTVLSWTQIEKIKKYEVSQRLSTSVSRHTTNKKMILYEDIYPLSRFVLSKLMLGNIEFMQKIVLILILFIR